MSKLRNLPIATYFFFFIMIDVVSLFLFTKNYTAFIPIIPLILFSIGYSEKTAEDCKFKTVWICSILITTFLYCKTGLPQMFLLYFVALIMDKYCFKSVMHNMTILKRIVPNIPLYLFIIAITAIQIVLFIKWTESLSLNFLLIPCNYLLYLFYYFYITIEKAKILKLKDFHLHGTLLMFVLPISLSFIVFSTKNLWILIPYFIGLLFAIGFAYDNTKQRLNKPAGGLIGKYKFDKIT